MVPMVDRGVLAMRWRRLRLGQCGKTTPFRMTYVYQGCDPACKSYATDIVRGSSLFMWAAVV